jgi:hypothetical protein
LPQSAAQNHRWTLVVADGEGDTANVVENEHAHLEQLLRAGLKALVGEHVDISLYDIMIDGTAQDDLTQTLAEAGLHDGSEVVILTKDVSRG